MVFARPASLAIALAAGLFLAPPLEAQTSATLNVSARVIEECTVKSKRELFMLAYKLKDPSIITRCSKGVVSRINQSVVKAANLQPRVAVPSNVSSKQFVRSSSSGKREVVLVTVTY